LDVKLKTSFQIQNETSYPIADQRNQLQDTRQEIEVPSNSLFYISLAVQPLKLVFPPVKRGCINLLVGYVLIIENLGFPTSPRS